MNGPNVPDAERYDSRALEAPEPPNLLADQQLPAPPQQERSRRARDSLLYASLALFAENGYEATTVDEITRRAGVAVGAFYLHFRSKRQVLHVLMNALVLDISARLGTFSDALRFPAEFVSSLPHDSPHAGVCRAWRAAALHDASIALVDAEIETWTSARIAAALRMLAVKQGVRASADLHSVAWMLSALWWRSLEHPAPDREALEKNVAVLVQSLMRASRTPSA
jgi:AcrR family transcriptional regulator